MKFGKIFGMKLENPDPTMRDYPNYSVYVEIDNTIYLIGRGIYAFCVLMEFGLNYAESLPISDSAKYQPYNFDPATNHGIAPEVILKEN